MEILKKLRIVAPLAAVCLWMTGATCQDHGANVAAPSGSLSAAKVTQVTVSDGKVVISGDQKLEGLPIVMTDPDRVAVDVKNAKPASGLETDIGGAGVIEKVEVKPLNYLKPPVVRVIAYLDEQANYSLDSDGQDLVLTLTPKVEPAAEKEPEQVAEEGTLPYDETKDELEKLLQGEPPSPLSATSEPMVDMSEYGNQQQSSSPYPPILTEMSPPNMDGSATEVGDILYRTGENMVQIMILTNGTVGDFLDFDVYNPSRIVVDLWGLSARTKKKVYTVGWAGVTQVRIGKHHDKARVVIDLKGRPQAYDVARTASGVVVTVYKAAYVPGGLNYKKHTTGSGESLRTVAQQVYGNPEDWPRLLAANRTTFTRQERKAIVRADGNVEIGENLDIKVPIR